MCGRSARHVPGGRGRWTVWVADEEDGLRVPVPILGEEFDDLVLTGGGILHLVDQEVLQARAEGGGKVIRAGFGGEGSAGQQGGFGEVALARAR